MTETTSNATARKFIGYVRVSTAGQAEDGISLEAQREKLAAWATLSGAELVEVVADEGVSAKVPFAERPGGARVLEALAGGEAEGLVFAKLDRVFRSTSDCVTTVDTEFRANGWELVSLAEQLDTTSSMGRFLLRMFASLAELERDRISERTAEAMQELLRQGVRFGAEGYGWRYTEATDDDGRRVTEAVHAERRTIERAKELRATGLSLRAIGEKLTAEGFATKRGGRWHAKTVRTLLAA